MLIPLNSPRSASSKPPLRKRLDASFPSQNGSRRSLLPSQVVHYLLAKVGASRPAAGASAVAGRASRGGSCRKDDGGSKDLRLEVARGGQRALRSRGLASDCTDVRKISSNSEGKPVPLPSSAQPVPGGRGRRRLGETNFDGHDLRRPTKKHKPLAVGSSRTTGGEEISTKHRDILAKKFRSLGSFERNGILRDTDEDEYDDVRRERGTPEINVKTKGIRRKRVNGHFMQTGSRFNLQSFAKGWNVQAHMRTVDRVRNLQPNFLSCHEDGKPSEAAELSDDWTQEHIQEPRKVEKKRSLEELDAREDVFLCSWARKAKRKPRMGFRKGDASHQMDEAYSRTRVLEAACDSQGLSLHVNLGDGVRFLGEGVVKDIQEDPLQEREGEDPLQEREEVVLVHTIEEDNDGRICTSEGIEHNREEQCEAFEEEQDLGSAEDFACRVSHQEEVAGLHENLSAQTSHPAAVASDNLGPLSKALSVDATDEVARTVYADEKARMAADMDATAGSCDPFPQEAVHLVTAAALNSQVEERHRDGHEISQAVGSGRSEDKPDACLNDEEVKLNLAEGRRCGLCGGGSDGEPPSNVAPGCVRSEDDQMLESDRLGLSYSDCDEFPNEPGWLGCLLGPLGDRVGTAGVWVHQECAIWSPEVYFFGLGHLKNVRSALRRGRLLKCSRCGQPGATIGCRVDRCPRTYHLACGRFEGCLFDHKKYLLACLDHLDLFLPRLPGSVLRRSQVDIGRIRFKKMFGERKKAAQVASQRDLEAEEKWQENAGEDDEFLRRERRRLQRDLARVAPVFVGGSDRNHFSEGWGSIAGLQSVVQCMKEMVILPLLYPDAFTKLGITPPRGVLLHGHPGTGKTLAVRALVGACAKGDHRIAYFARKGADCLGKYVGDAERQLRLLFQVAEHSQPSIIFFDEIDGLAPKRSQHQDQTQKSVVSTLLSLMDGLKSRGSVIVIGATNRPDALDPALRRPGRFDREIYFPLPSTADRAAILALHTRKWETPPSDKILSFVARETSGYAGADLQALCAEAAMISLKRSITFNNLLSAVEIKGLRELPALPALPSLNVKMNDWIAALEQAPLPCSQRIAKAAVNDVFCAPLSRHLASVLLWPMVEVLVCLHLDARVTLPPVLENASVLVEAALKSASAGAQGGSLMESLWLARSCSRMNSNSCLLKAKLDEALEDALCATGMISAVDVAQHVVAETKSQAQYSGSRFCIMLLGEQMSGQDLLAPWILYGFEGFAEKCKLSLPTMLQEGGGDVIQGLLQILCKVRSICPCVVFMPEIESWAVEVTDDGQIGKQPKASQSWNVFMQQTSVMPSNLPIVFLASCSVSKYQLPPEIVQFFSGGSEQLWLSSRSKYHLSTDSESKLGYPGETELSSCGSMPCAWVQMPSSVDTKKVFDRAAQDYAKLFSTRFLHAISFSRGQLHASDNHSGETRMFQGLLNSTGLQELGNAGNSMSCEENFLEQTMRIETHRVFGDPDSRIADISLSDCNQNIHNLLSQDLAHGKQLPDGQSENSAVARSFAKTSSPEQRALSLAIVSCGYQLLNHPELADLRHATFKLSEGPFVHMRRHRKAGSSGSGDGSNWQKDDKDDFPVLRGLVAVGLLAYNGLYETSLEVSCAVEKVFELLIEKINQKVKQGKDRLQFFRLLSQVAALEDNVFSWAHDLQRLEVAAKVPVRPFHCIGSKDLSTETARSSVCPGRDIVESSPVHNVQPDVACCPCTPVYANVDLALDGGILTENCRNDSAKPYLELDLNGQPGLQIMETCIATDFKAEGDNNRDEGTVAAGKMRKDVLETKHPWKCCPECMIQVECALKELFLKSWRHRGAVCSLDVVNDVVCSSSAFVSASVNRFQRVEKSFEKGSKGDFAFQQSIMPQAFPCECLKSHKLGSVPSHRQGCNCHPVNRTGGKGHGRCSIKNDSLLAEVSSYYQDQHSGVVTSLEEGFVENKLDAIHVCLCPLLKVINDCDR